MIPQISLKEKTMPVEALRALPCRDELCGVVRFVDSRGGTCGYFLGALSRDDLGLVLERMEAATPEFQKEMEESIASGRVSSEEIERELGLK